MSEVDQASLRISHGRGMNTVSSTYILPSDAPEHERLAAQHKMWLLLLGGLCPVDLELQNLLNTSDATVLDVGCGAGHWSIQFAIEHPAVRVVGFDLARSSNTENPPPNFQFVQGDITKDMNQFFGQVDLINCRAVLGHLKDATSALVTFHRCLKPGGAIVVSEGDTRTFSRDRHSLALRASDSDADNSRSWVSRFLYETEQLNWKGVDQCGRHLDRLLRNNGGFIDIDVTDYYSPFGWCGDGVSHGKELSIINRLNLSALALAYKPSFLERKHAAEAVINKWCNGVNAEVNDPSVERYLVFHVAWARRSGKEVVA